MAQFPSITSASSIWSLQNQKRAQQGNNWPPLGGVDPQFNYVTMLLPGNGTNGAQNNTFLDSSANAFSMTRNGNITQGTFTPYGPNWSNYFDGSSNLRADSSFVIGSNSFTYEGYVFLLNGNSQQVLFCTTNSNGYMVIVRYSAVTGTYHFMLQLTQASGYIDTGIQVSAYLNKWTHVALTSGNNFDVKFFLNGSLVFTTTGTSFGTVSNSAFIGASPYATDYLIGYLSNVRFVIGTEVYTSNFTPPTTPLTAIANTRLLTCQSNRFIDNGNNSLAITVTGSPSVEVFSPFSPTTSYATGTIGGSGYASADGYLTTTGDCLPKGTVNCCVEFWWYPITHTVNVGWCKANLSSGIWFEYQGAGSLASVSFEVYTQGGGGVSSLFGGNAYASAGKFQPKQWNHVAYVRTGDTHSVYCNGIRLATTTNSIDWQTDTNNLILTSFTNQRFLYGYVSSFRSVVGSSPYNANNATITVPTTQLTAIANTKLLLNFTNGGIIDNAMMNDLQTVGNAQISTAQSKFGGSSIYFAGGSTGWLYSSQIARLNGQLGATYTIEMFLRVSNVTSFSTFFRTNVSSTGNNTILWRVGGGDLFFDSLNSDNATTTRISGGGLSVNTWYHIAVSASQNSGKMFVNGVQVGSTVTFNPSSLVADTLYIGELGSASGYIDDLRITKGFARYTANFTPPTAAFPTQ